MPTTTPIPKRRRGRPPKELAGYSETREAMIQAGLAALTKKGFSATGLDEVLRSVNVPKGSFYHYFGSKEAFGAELIDQYAAYFAAKLDKFFLNEGRTPLQRLRDLVSDAEAGMARFDFARGCLIGNLGQELGALPESYRGKLIDVFADWQARTAKCLKEAQAVGEISVDQNPRKLAAFFWIGWEGAALRAKLERSPKPLRIFADGFIAAITT
jgi:TetR/AcrR family transcriptional repressor of nem operon